MSQNYAGQDPLDIARKAEASLNSAALQDGGKEDTSMAKDPDSSGIDPSVTSSFPGSTVTTGPATSGRQIPPEQGGDTIIDSGRTKASHPSDGPGQSGSRSEQRMTKDSDFEGEGGPEDKIAQIERDQGGDDQVRGNIR